MRFSGCYYCQKSPKIDFLPSEGGFNFPSPPLASRLLHKFKVYFLTLDSVKVWHSLPEEFK